MQLRKVEQTVRLFLLRSLGLRSELRLGLLEELAEVSLRKRPFFDLIRVLSDVRGQVLADVEHLGMVVVLTVMIDLVFLRLQKVYEV